MGRCGREVGMVGEVDAHETVHNDFTVERVLYGLGDGDVVEDDDDALE